MSPSSTKNTVRQQVDSQGKLGQTEQKRKKIQRDTRYTYIHAQQHPTPKRIVAGEQTQAIIVAEKKKKIMLKT